MNPSLTTPLPNKIESDIRRHASRMRSSSKDYSARAVGSASSRDTSTPNFLRKGSSNKGSKQITLVSTEHDEHHAYESAFRTLWSNC